MSPKAAITYAFLNEEEKLLAINNRIRDLEREHYYLMLSLRIAEAKMEKGLANAESEVVDLTERLNLIELSLSALGQLIS